MTGNFDWKPSPSLANFGLVPRKPGYVYVFENNNKYKIGRSKNPAARAKAAKTWLPDMTVIGIKPFWNHIQIERLMHIGFACSWYAGEWFRPYDEGISEIFVDGFSEFCDADINSNSIDFIYWFNGNGMSEFVHEQCQQKSSVKEFLIKETWVKEDTKLTSV